MMPLCKRASLHQLDRVWRWTAMHCASGIGTLRARIIRFTRSRCVFFTGLFAVARLSLIRVRQRCVYLLFVCVCAFIFFKFCLHLVTLFAPGTFSSSSSSSSSSTSSLPPLSRDFDFLRHAPKKGDYRVEFGSSSAAAHYAVPLFVDPLAPASPRPMGPPRSLQGANTDLREVPGSTVVLSSNLLAANSANRVAITAAQLCAALTIRLKLDDSPFSEHQYPGVVRRDSSDVSVAAIHNVSIFTRVSMRPGDDACLVASMLWTDKPERSLVLVCDPKRDQELQTFFGAGFQRTGRNGDARADPRHSWLHPALVLGVLQADLTIVPNSFKRHRPQDWRTSYASFNEVGRRVSALFLVVDFFKPLSHTEMWPWETLAEVWSSDVFTDREASLAQRLVPLSRVCGRASLGRLQADDAKRMGLDKSFGVPTRAGAIVVTPLPLH